MDNRLKTKDLKHVRQRMWEEQGGICTLCGNKIESDPVLDHCHDTGHVRGVLHRQCNHAEGRIKDWILRTGKRTDPVIFLQNLAEYIDSCYSHNPVHPSHKTPAEKEIQKLRKKMKQVKKPETKVKYQQQIQKLQEGK